MDTTKVPRRVGLQTCNVIIYREVETVKWSTKYLKRIERVSLTSAYRVQVFTPLLKTLMNQVLPEDPDSE
jgi:hypothetical protein